MNGTIAGQVLFALNMYSFLYTVCTLFYHFLMKTMELTSSIYNR